MKKLFFTLVFSLILGLVSLAAQPRHTVTGRVVNSADGAPVAFATITLAGADSVAVAGQITGPEGDFSMNSVAAGSYTLSVSFVGYETILRPISVPEGSDAGEIRLREAANAIAAVVVTARRPFVEQQADRYVVNVSSGITTTGRNGMEVLANTPGVMVHDGEIRVMAKGVTVYIDGRPSGLSGEQLTTLLASIQGDNINRIEVITNPSSRYDAEGQGGIIDIRTKRGIQYGFNATIDAGYRQGRRDTENGGITLNYRRKGFNVFGNYSATRTDNWMKLSQQNGTRGADDVLHIFDQSAVRESDKAQIGQTYRLGLDYYINDKNIIGLLYNGYRTGNEIAHLNGLTTITPALDGVASSSIFTESARDNNGNQLNLNYRGLFAKPGRQLNIDLDYGRFRSSPWQRSDIGYFDTAGSAIAAAGEHLRHTNPQDIEVLSAKADFSTPLWENAKMDIGAKSSRTTTDNNLLHEELIDGRWSIDEGRTNDFDYRETIHAGYVSFNQKFGKIDFQAGLRGEYTDSEGNQRTTGEVNKKDYFELFPTLYVNYNLSREHRLGLSYGRRIMRPLYGQLNPFETRIDAYSFERGNPDLKPSYINNISLNYSYGQSLIVRLSYDNRRDVITQVPVQEEGRYGIERANYGRNNTFAVMVNYRTSPFKWWNINAMVMGRHSSDYSQESFGELSETSLGLMAQFSNNFRITPTLSAELTGVYQSRIQQAYMAVNPAGNLSIGVRKSLLDNKLSISLAANDLLGTMVSDGESVVDNLIYKVNMRRDTRYVALSARWNFGAGNARAARNRTSGIEDERSRAQ
jgi:outer membrane receptor protein involved in Fe transport